MPESSRGDLTNDGDIVEKSLSHESATGLQELCAQLHCRIAQFLETKAPTHVLERVQEQTRIALGVVEDALQRYSLEELALSYNGGKDCLVLLIIYLAALHSHFDRLASSSRLSAASQHSASQFPRRLKSVYIQSSHPFLEVEHFVQSSSKQYHLSLASSSLPMKAAFAQYLDLNPKVKAIFVGTRRTDPHGGKLTHFDETDSGWPPFMRIHPVIDWHYQEIWGFIRHLDIPYCKIYDMGYTSLGGTTDTHPNPKLRKAESGTGAGTVSNIEYRPAYELIEDDEERLGRDWNKK